VHALGETDYGGSKDMKVSAEKASDLMKIVGTIKGAEKYPGHEYMRANDHGYPTFLFKDLLDTGQIKAYLGYKHTKLVTLLAKMVEKRIGPVLVVPIIQEAEVEAQDALNTFTHCPCNGTYNGENTVVCNSDTCTNLFHHECIGYNPNDGAYVCDQCKHN
jgi:hypothetical protein